MKILHTGDWHIGTMSDPDVQAAALEIIHKAKVIIPDLIILAGDIYNGDSSPDDRNMAKDLVRQLADIAPILIIKGNHDARRDLLILGDLKAQFTIRVDEIPGTMILGDTVITTLPWFSKSAWVAARVGIDMGIESGNEAVSLLALQYLKIQVAKHPESKNLLFAHLMVSGSKIENHQPLLGEGITFGYHDLAEAGFVGGGFSHIHLAQSFGDRSTGSPEFRYPGSIAALNYGESARNKGFSVFDTDTLTFETIPLSSIARINLDAYWGPNGLGWLAPEGLPTEKGARVKVKLLIEEGYSSEDAEKAVRESPLIVEPLELKVERQTKPRDLVRAQEIAAAQTACQKLEAYWSATKTTPDEPMRADMLTITSEAETECRTKTDRR
jgi:DNA repair exonuclease SbcCD nuclease subunit